MNDIIRTYRHPLAHQQRALALAKQLALAQAWELALVLALAQELAQALAHSGGDQGCACAHPLPKDPHK